MRQWYLGLILSVIVIILAGCTEANNSIEASSEADVKYETSAADKEDESAEEPDVDEQQNEMTNEETIVGVSIDFDYIRMAGKASNQLAAWIEDEEGVVVKTIYATDFTAGRRGYINREDALSHWVEAAKPEELDDAEIDAVSSATPQSGQ